MPKDVQANLFSIIKKDKEIEMLRRKLKEEKAYNKTLLKESSSIRVLTSSLQNMLEAKDKKISTLQTNLSLLLEEQTQLKISNQALTTYLSQPFWKRWTQRLRFFLSLTRV